MQDSPTLSWFGDFPYKADKTPNRELINPSNIDKYLFKNNNDKNYFLYSNPGR